MIKIKNRFFFILAFSMGLVVALSNYLVQFPITYMSLEEIFTYGAFSYPVAFLITDLANRRYGKEIARKIVYIGFVLGLFLTLYFSTDFSNLISKRIAIGSGIAFLTAQLLDVQVFDKLILLCKETIMGDVQAVSKLYFCLFFIINFQDLINNRNKMKSV